MLIGSLDQLVEQVLALDRIRHCGKLFAEPQPHRTFETHPADLAGRPGDGELRGVEGACGHRHCSQPIALAQDDHSERHGEPRADDEQPAESPDCGLDFGIRSDHESGCVTQRNDRQPGRVAQRQKVGDLVSGLGVDGPAEMMTAVGQQSEWRTFDADQRGDHADPVVGP